MNRLLIAFGLLAFSATAVHAQFAPRPGVGGGSGVGGGAGSGPSGGNFGGGAGLSGGIGTTPSGAGFSPYLNLFSGNRSAAVNLYGIVRPQQSLQQGIQNLQASYIAGSPSEEAQAGVAVIGTKVRFLNTGGYFLNLSGGTTPLSSGGGGSGFSGPQTGAGGGLNSFGNLPSSSGLSLPQQGGLGGSGTGSFGAPTPKGGGRPAGSSKN